MGGMQVFPADMPGQYINKVDFGLVKADLLASYRKTARDNIDVSFVYINFMLGPLSYKQVHCACTLRTRMRARKRAQWLL